MGQYYKAIIIDNDNKPTQFLTSWSLGNGSKLMEHSWIGNGFVGAIEQLLFQNPLRVVWAGDYADAEKDKDGNEIKTLPQADGRTYGINLYSICVEQDEDDRNDWSEETKALYPYLTELKVKKKKAPKTWRYLVNHDTKEFIDKNAIPVSNVWTDPNSGKEWPFIINPLPLMTCEGNGQGGGDYRYQDTLPTECEKKIGTWARALISIERTQPKGYTKVAFDLKEE